MICIGKTFEFEAAHFIPMHKGACRELHGHSYKMEIVITGEIGPLGMIMDFSDLKKMVQENLWERLDHVCLNDWFFPPTAERMVQVIAKRLQIELEKLSDKTLSLVKVKLWETSSSYAEWRMEK